MRGRPVTYEEAMDAAIALIDYYFHNKTDHRVQVSIPVRVDDTDVLLCDYLCETSERIVELKRTGTFAEVLDNEPTQS